MVLGLVNVAEGVTCIHIYYSQFDQHNCIDFHRVNCNEPTPFVTR